MYISGKKKIKIKRRGNMKGGGISTIHLPDPPLEMSYKEYTLHISQIDFNLLALLMSI